ncbi:MULTISPECIES: peptidase inhibitor family I36 protein [unclassified Streptomyces]|uniref:peptidase inhibitor family I36 protein n=1 Tax=unclassified Streptomyces TaxID=2593676 RepID=UPI000B122A5F|nr:MULTISPECIES: peptidase inhibitor family I36 protein [unclassified Streptomyces]
MQRTALRRVAATAVALVAIGAGALATAGSASAATGKNGYLESGELGLYYNSNQAGAVFDLYIADDNFSDDWFPGPGNGAGQPVNDNTASYHNADSLTWYVYTDAYAGGIEGSLPPGYVGNASTTFKNQISSAYHYKAR